MCYLFDRQRKVPGLVDSCRTMISGEALISDDEFYCDLLPLSDCFHELCPDLPIMHSTQLLKLIDQTFEIVRISAPQTGY